MVPQRRPGHDRYGQRQPHHQVDHQGRLVDRHRARRRRPRRSSGWSCDCRRHRSISGSTIDPAGRSSAPPGAATADAAARSRTSSTAAAPMPSLQPPCRRPVRCRFEWVSSSEHGLAQVGPSPIDPRRKRCISAAEATVLPTPVSVPVTKRPRQRPASFSAAASASTNRSSTASDTPALTETRSRAVPGGTLGGRIARTSNPPPEARRPPATARLVVADDDRHDLRVPSAGKAGSRSRRRRQSRARLRSRSRRSGSSSTTVRLASSASASAGGGAVEKTNGPRALNEILDRPGRTGDERARHAERLPRRIDGQAHVVRDAGLFDQAAAARAVDARPRAPRPPSSTAPAPAQIAAYSASGASRRPC